jgi:hypothetical protein
MKTQSTSFFAEISKAYLMRLTEEVKETVALDIITHSNARILSAADVWNIQRNKRARVQRRFSL